MTNLAQKHENSQGEVIAFPKLERQVMSDKDEGFTPMPNFICDEGYLAALDGNAIKCLWLLNRHVKGFHLKAKGMSEALVMKITGIKDGRTVQKYMGELAKVQLIKIEKERGKSNVYSLTFNDRLPTQNVGTSKAKTQNVPTSDVGTPPTQHVGGSTHTACHSVKEIDLKENSKRNNKNTAQENFEPQNRGALNFIDYHSDDPKLYTLKDLSGVYPIKNDFMAQAAVSYPNLSEAVLLEQLKELAQWSVGQTPRRSQKWMTTWLNWLKNYQAPKPTKPKTSKKTNSNLNVNDAWKDQAVHHTPVENLHVDIPEDFV